MDEARSLEVDVPDFSRFKVLLDDPALTPALGFDDYASAFAEIIQHSAPQFAIGIFGDWGSGKTTLMRAIERELAANDEVIPVWFNAWRYEREEHLIVPLLDTLREALAAWSERRPPGDDGRSRAKEAAATVARAARALIVGFSLKAPLGGVEASFDPKRVMEAWQDGESLAQDPVSFYHASFNAMRDAIDGFVRGSDRRIVVFVDDLDRCLPENALQVLESMKLFFDLEGFVFVVGLDQSVIERAIELKYQTSKEAVPTPGESEDGGPRRRPATTVTGADYVKKIFQVPFGLPRVNPGDLRAFFDAMISGADLPDEQASDLWNTVWPHLEFISEDGTVNPREVKRLVNAYTLQMKLLSAKLRPQEPDPNVVLALQLMAFRSEWRRLYELLAADSTLFLEALRAAIEDRSGSMGFVLSREPLPPRFLTYVRGVGQTLREVSSLDTYITSAETTASSDPTVLEAQTLVARLRHLLAQLRNAGSRAEAERMATDLADKASRLTELMQHKASRSPLAYEIGSLATRLRTEVTSPLGDEPAPWAERAESIVSSIDENLSALRREAFVGSSAA